MVDVSPLSHGHDLDESSPEFDEGTRRELLMEDRNAWVNVTGILIAIVSIGLLLAFIAVCVSLSLKNF
jgi:hypothetical protein